MNLIDEIRKFYGSNEAQLRGPSPGKEGGSDTGKLIQPLARNLSKKGIIRRVVPGNFPKVTPDKSGKLKDEDKKMVRKFLKGQNTLALESSLINALLSNQQFLEEEVKRQKPVRKEMSGAKKALIGAAVAAALAGGIASKSKSDSPSPHQGQSASRWDGTERGPTGQGKYLRSMGRGRVTQDKDLAEGSNIPRREDPDREDRAEYRKEGREKDKKRKNRRNTPKTRSRDQWFARAERQENSDLRRDQSC
jgi:hypothetical protein